MICHQNKLIYIHIFKTAGVSIESFFEEPLYNHNTGTKILGKIGQEKWDSYFKFTTVRNSWDRMLSFYFCRIAKGGQVPRIPQPIKCGSNHQSHMDNFEEWIERVSLDQPMVMQQSHWTIVNEKMDMDFIAHFENLHEDFLHVCEQINITPSTLPHLNKTTHRHYSQYYTEKSKSIVAEVCKEDIETFEFTFEENSKPVYISYL